MNPLISVIIPTLNSSSTIDDTLKSVINQEEKNFEIIILDGISSDDTLNRVNIFNDSRIRIYSEKDRGIYDAMNKGVKKALGQWLFFLGSDDRLFDNKVFSEIVNTINLIPKDIKVIYGNVLIKGSTGWAENNQIYDGKFEFDKLLKKNICHQSIFYHNEVFQNKIKFDINYPVCADWNFNLIIFKKYRFKYIEKTISIFNAGGVSTNVFNNYDDVEKWYNLIKFYRFRIFNKEFKIQAQNLKGLSKIAMKKKMYSKSVLFLVVYYVSKIIN